MPDDSMVKKVYEWKPMSTRSKGRPKHRWEDNVKSDVANMRITNWKDCIRNRPKWKEFVEKAKTSLKLWRLKKKKKNKISRHKFKFRYSDTVCAPHFVAAKRNAVK